MRYQQSRKVNQTRNLLAGMVLAVAAVQSITPPVVASDGHGFVSKKYDIKGGWQIVQENGQALIRFGDSFKTKKDSSLSNTKFQPIRYYNKRCTIEVEDARYLKNLSTDST